ncbi:MAG: hypothetical protein LBO75_05485, partial [Bifidobacteriaceae bacterium]|nr:hypothetical protein [Bifidobacteriaceae bacterium]
SALVVEAALGEAATASNGVLMLPDAARRLTKAIETAYAPARSSIRVALIGAHGGAGVSCLAAALAWRLSGERPVRLVALNPAGAPLGPLMGAGPAPGWEAALRAVGNGGALGLATAGAVEWVSESGPTAELNAWRIRQVVEAWETQSGAGYTVMDASRAGPCGGWRAASWADLTVVVARLDPLGVTAAQSLIRELKAMGLSYRLAVREIPGGLKATDLDTDGLAPAEVLTIKPEKGLVAALVHGVIPGEKAVGRLAGAARVVANWAAQTGEVPQAVPELWVPSAPESWSSPVVVPAEEPPQVVDPQAIPPRTVYPQTTRRVEPRDQNGRRHMGWRRQRRQPAPSFNPDAFAEEW